jgi:hypothetical protein
LLGDSKIIGFLRKKVGEWSQLSLSKKFFLNIVVKQLLV